MRRSDNYRLKHKRASSYIVPLLIGLAVLLILLVFVYKEYLIAEDSRQKQICKEAVRISALTKIKGDDSALRLFISPERETSDVPCPVIYKEVSGDADRVKAELARMMYDSWDMMHKGELNLFSGKTGEETYCVLTHHIKFKDDHEITGFTEYLSETKIPTGEMYYSEYLRCFNPTPELFSGPAAAADDTIHTGQDYGIMFLYTKKGYMQKLWKGLKLGAYGGAAGAVIAGTTLLLIPEPTGITKGMGIMILGAGSGAAAEGTIGYLTGSEKAADWQACVLLFPYNEATLKNMNCTYMPGVQGK